MTWGYSIDFRKRAFIRPILIAVGPHQGRKVFTGQTLPGCNEPFDDSVGKVVGVSLHAGVAARADERKKLGLGKRAFVRLIPRS
jgi:hypothetical protein